MDMRKTSELAFNVALLIIDYVALVTAFVLAYIVRVKLDGRPVPNPIHAAEFFRLALVSLPVWIIIFALTGLYSQSSLRGRVEEIGKILVAVAGGTMFLILVDFLSIKPLFPSKSIPVYGLLFSIVLVIIGRQIVRLVQRWLFRYGVGVHQAVLVGSGEIAQRILADIGQTSRSGYRLVAVIDHAAGAQRRMGRLKVFKNLAEVVGTFGPKSIDEFIQADSALEPEEILDIIGYANNHHIGYQFVPNQFGLYATNSSITVMAGYTMVSIRHTPLDGWGRIAKRAFDIIGASLGLIITAPIWLLVSVMIKFSDPGPILYKQERLVRKDKTMILYKFRTMYTRFCTGPGYRWQTPEEAISHGLGRADLAKEYVDKRKLQHDPRITLIGRFLRRTSLDELPQLINVLKGQISLVGPRPIPEGELHYYGDRTPIFFALKPGLTGLWQVSGRNDLDYEDRVKLDIYYVENWTLLLDLRILWRTIPVIIRRRGAY